MNIVYVLTDCKEGTDKAHIELHLKTLMNHLQ